MSLPAMTLPMVALLTVLVIHGAVAALLLRRGAGRGLANAVGLACVVTALAALVIAATQTTGAAWPRSLALVEVLRTVAWLNVLRLVALPRAQAWVRACWGLAGGYGLLILLLPDAHLLPAIQAGGAVLALASLFTLFRLWLREGTAPSATLTPLLLGVAVPWLFDLLGALSGPRSLADLGWLAALQLLSLPLILLGIRRVAAVEPMAFVSRQVVLLALALLTIAAYIGLTALAAEALPALMGTPTLRLVLVVLAALLFGMLVAAPSVRRRLGVLVATHFYRNKYDYRVEWLRFIQTLSSGPASADPATAILAVAQMFESPAGALYARDEFTGRFERRALWPRDSPEQGLPSSLAGDDALIDFLVQRRWVVDREEQQRDPALYGSFVVPPWLQPPWRIVTPLLQQNSLVGILVLAAPPAPFRMNFEDRDLFKTVGRHIALQLTQQNAERRLAEGRQFDAYNRFAAFVMHDLKNSVAQLQLVVQNARRHRHNPQFIDDAISTIANSVERMTGLIAQLQSRDVQGQVRELALTTVVEAALARARARTPAPSASLPTAPVQVRADADKLGAVLDHVIRNAQEATGESGQVELQLTVEAGWARLAVRDDGPGMDESFLREGLFRPFHSTKGSRGMGIGAYQAREYVHSLGGSVEVQSSPGRGTTFCIRLPTCQTASQDS